MQFAKLSLLMIASLAARSVTRGSLVVGGSGGIDVPLDFDRMSDLDPVGHVAGSIGIARPRFGIGLGAAAMKMFAGKLQENSQVSVQAIGDVAVRSRTRLYGALGLSSEDGTEAFSFGVGLRAGL